MAKGRGRLNSIQLLPQECSSVIMWAADELQKLERPQNVIYQEFAERLEEVRRDAGIEFKTPGSKSFNRYSLNLAAAAQEIADTRAMAAAVMNSIDPEDSDETTKFAVESIKAAVVATLRTKKGKLDPKSLLDLSNTMRAAALALATSATHRQKIETELAAKVNNAVDTVAKAKGLTRETVSDIKSKILGVRTK